MDRYYIYDGTFNGLLSAIGIAYEKKEYPLEIISHDAMLPFMTQNCFIHTDIEKTQYIADRILVLTGQKGFELMVFGFLSRFNTIETALFEYLYATLTAGVETHFQNDENNSIVAKAAQAVKNELSRVNITFLLYENDIFYAPVDLFYNILPLLIKPFEKKMSGKRWIIHDQRRKTGLYNNGKETYQLNLAFATKLKKPSENKDNFFEKMWLNIAAEIESGIQLPEMKEKIDLHFLEKIG